MKRTFSPPNTSDGTTSAAEILLAQSLFVLDHNGIDQRCRSRFTKSFSTQVSSRNSRAARIHAPDLSRPEAEAWASALQSYARYLTALHDPQQQQTQQQAQVDEENFDESESVSNNGLTAEDQIQRLIETRRQSPSHHLQQRKTSPSKAHDFKKRVDEFTSPIRTKGTQTRSPSPTADRSPTKKTTKTNIATSPKRSPSPQNSPQSKRSPSKRSPSPSLNRSSYSNKSVQNASPPLARSQPSRQSRGTVTSPPTVSTGCSPISSPISSRNTTLISSNAGQSGESANTRKSMLAKLIESSPKYCSYLQLDDEDNDDDNENNYNNENDDSNDDDDNRNAKTQTTNANAHRSPPHSPRETASFVPLYSDQTEQQKQHGKQQRKQVKKLNTITNTEISISPKGKQQRQQQRQQLSVSSPKMVVDTPNRVGKNQRTAGKDKEKMSSDFVIDEVLSDRQ